MNVDLPLKKSDFSPINEETKTFISMALCEAAIKLYSEEEILAPKCSSIFRQ